MATAAAELTDQEAKVAQMLGEAWNEYLKLPIEHPIGAERVLQRYSCLPEHCVG